MRKRLYQSFGVLSFLFAVLWYALSPFVLGALPDHYHKSLRQSGETHLYTAEGEERTMSVENVEMAEAVISNENGVLLIESVFRAFNREGTLDFDATSNYAIDVHSRKNLAGHVDQDREGMYMFPSFAKRTNYYMHSPMVLEAPEWARFVDEVEFRGEKFYKYEYSIPAVDKTEFFKVAKLAENEAIYGTHDGFMLVEPVSGYVVHFSHRGRNDVVNADTGIFIRPYEDWFNVTNEDSSDLNIQYAMQRKQAINSLRLMPVFFLLLLSGLFFYFSWAHDNKKWQKYLSQKELSLVVVSLFAASIGLFAVFGWLFDVVLFKSLISGLPTMKVSTAFSFFMIGFSYFLISSQKRDELEQLLIVMSSGVVLILMALLGLSAALELDIDIIALDDGRPSNGTMLCFILLAAIAVIDVVFKRVDSRFYIFAYGLIALIPMMALMGYLINMPMLYFAADGHSTGMAVHTAVLFVALSLTALFSHFPTIKLKK